MKQISAMYSNFTSVKQNQFLPSAVFHRVDTFQKVKIELLELFPSLKTEARVVHQTRHKPKTDLKASRPKVKHIATCFETQIETENILDHPYLLFFNITLLQEAIKLTTTKTNSNF